MNKRIASAAVAASLLGGAGLGAVAMTPMTAFAEEGSTEQSARTPGQWITDALAGLVDDGTINQEQSDAVAAALDEAKPEHGHGGPRGPGKGLDAAAEALGTTVDEIRTAQESGTTLAALADQKGVEVQKVIDALVADHTARIDEQLSDGKLTAEQAEQRKADAVERATDMVNNTMPAGGPGGPRGEMTPPNDSAQPAA